MTIEFEQNSPIRWTSKTSRLKTMIDRFIRLSPKREIIPLYPKDFDLLLSTIREEQVREEYKTKLRYESRTLLKLAGKQHANKSTRASSVN